MSINEKQSNKPGSMVAPKSTEQAKLMPIEELAAAANVPPHALAGMCRANGWAEGKQLSAAEFIFAVNAYRTRPMGNGGRL